MATPGQSLCSRRPQIPQNRAGACLALWFLGVTWRGWQQGFADRAESPRGDTFQVTFPACLARFLGGHFSVSNRERPRLYLYPTLEPGKNNPGVFGSLKALLQILRVSEKIKPRSGGSRAPAGKGGAGGSPGLGPRVEEERIE